MYDDLVSVASLKKTMNTLSFRKSSILVSVTLLFFLLLLSSLGNTSASDIQQDTVPPDADQDGLSDDLETSLGLPVNDKFGDNDSDGLYDFEELLDWYGSNNTDSPKYKYNDSTTIGSVLDIYSVFGLTSDKTGYLRDQNFTLDNGGFTDYLLWNVTFNETRAGGALNTTAVTYSNNILMDVKFSGTNSGGSVNGATTYSNNILTNVVFGGSYSGGSVSSGTVLYSSNMLTNVNFTGGISSGGITTGSALTYRNNTLTNVFFKGISAGGAVSSGTVTYDINTFTDVGFSGLNTGRSRSGTTTYTDNTIVSDSYDNDDDGLGDIWEATYHSVSGVNSTGAASASDLASDTDNDTLTLLQEAGALTNPTSNDTDNDGLLDGWEVTYSAAAGVDPLVAATSGELASDKDNDTLTLMQEFGANTDPTMNDTDSDTLPDAWEVRYSIVFGVNATDGANASELASDTDSDGLSLIGEFNAGTDPTSDDTDGDGLNDGWEVTYKSVEGVNATGAAGDSVLTSDTDNDTLTLSQEAEAGTDPTSNDTDGDGLNDGWEVNYRSVSGVNATVNASASDLTSDTDNDTLTLLQEAEAGTDPTSDDTDGDGLPDGWEVEYIAIPGVDPLVAADDSVLESDTDGDGQTLLEEAKANKDPETADNDPMPMPMPMNTTTTATTATTAADTMSTSASSSETGGESSITFLVVLPLFTFFGLALVISRMRRRML